MEKVLLKKIAKQVRGVSYKPDDLGKEKMNGFVPLLRAGNIGASSISNLDDLVFVSEKNVSAQQYLQSGDILIAASSGSIDIVGKSIYIEEKNEYTFGAFCKVVRPNKDLVNPKYISFYFQTDFYRKKISNLAQGANINNLRNEHIDNLEIPLPDLETQNKIVAILDKAKAILDKREQAIKKYDELLRAVFLDMFGDPVFNEKGFNQVQLSNKEYFKIQGGGTPSKSKDEYYGNEIPWVTPKDMKFDLIHNSKINLSSLGLKNSTAKLIESFSTLVVIRSGILKHSLPVGISTKEVTINQDLKAITPLKTKPFFTYWNIKLYEKALLEKVRAVTADNIDSEILFSISILNPDESKQNEFEKIAKIFYKCKEQVTFSKLKIEYLLNCISQLAFKGELTFNTAVDLEVLLENDYDFFKANSSVKSIQLLLERLDTNELNANRFNEQSIYDKAKSFVFELLKEGKVKQVFDEVTQKVKLTVA